MKLSKYEMSPKSGFALAETIIDRTCEEYGVPRETMMSRNRSKTVFEARRTAMRRVRMQARLSQKEIGDLFDRDHSSVYRALC